VRTLYSWLVRAAAPVAFVALLWRGIADPAYRAGRRERLGFGAPAPAGGAATLWLHAVSLGEMTAAAPLIRALSARFPAARWVLTTATPAGRARAQALFPAAAVRFLPYDTPGAMRRFLTRIAPQVAIIMETELWPNLAAQCRRQGIPVFIANARMTDRSLSRYRRFGRLFAELLSANVRVAAQSGADAARFRALGAPAEAVQVVGNVKFDLELDASAAAPDAAARRTWIAGSTHAGEEEQVLDAHAVIRAAVPEALLVLVPRHRERFEAVAALLAQRHVDFVRRSAGIAPQRACVVVLADTLGELVQLYAGAQAAFVGGSLVPVGGHNLLEPAALGVPVITGPFTGNAPDIAALLIERGAALQVSDAAALAAAVLKLLEDPALRERMGCAGRELVAANRGSVARLVALIGPVLAAARPSGAR
jgi:3-deoxy-D-manno-octulosonic-acid transferase